MIHPDVVVLEDEAEGNEFRKIIPLYSPMDGVKQGILRKLIEEALNLYGEDVKSIFPESVEQHHELVPLPVAFQHIHSPEEDLYKEGPRHTYIERLILEEYMLFQSALWMNRTERKKEKGIPFRPQGPFYKKFTDTLPFALTDAQKRVIHEIESDMASAEPMNRLVQGDVGSGKTICAVIASCAAIDNGYQVAFMAPTEILAEQHYLSIHRFFEALDIPIAFLRGNMGKDRKAVLDGIHSGNIAVIVGTHAIIQKDVAFHNLGLVVIDEQHRFGVLQRRWLIEKGLTPDVLMMTATPIPRTLSMVVYGDLDVSVIDEMPKGRQGIKTKVFLEDNKAKVYEMIEGEIKAGHQVFIVYPLVEESDKMDLLDATKMASYFQKSIFSQYRVGLLHGSMKAEEKEKTMTRFKDRMIDILVCTTVIEVGIDVPERDDDCHRARGEVWSLTASPASGPCRQGCPCVKMSSCNFFPQDRTCHEEAPHNGKNNRRIQDSRGRYADPRGRGHAWNKAVGYPPIQSWRYYSGHGPHAPGEKYMRRILTETQSGRTVKR